jgi:hypothetical protein
MNASRGTSFWTSLPGILTGTAAVLTAVTGIVLALRGSPSEQPPAATTPAAAVTPAASPTPPATNASDSGAARSFVRQGSFRVGAPTEFVVSPQDLGLQDVRGFLTLVDAAYGTATPDEHAPNMFKLELRITNTAPAPLHLDLTERFFTLEDDHGRQATLRDFCCRAQGDLLAPGQSRSLFLFFYSSDWYGKEIGARRILLKVNGLLPVERATWEFPVLATAA